MAERDTNPLIINFHFKHAFEFCVKRLSESSEKDNFIRFERVKKCSQFERKL
jgi:hypothetical protein